MRPSIAISLLLLPAASIAAEFPSFRGQVIDPRVGDVCYAVTTTDVDAMASPTSWPWPATRSSGTGTRPGRSPT